MVKCSRCGEETHYVENCVSCKQLVCRTCHKSSKTSKKSGKTPVRMVICKSCWTRIPAKKAFLGG